MNIFIEVSLIISIAAGVALVMQLLKLPLILGHILTGIAVGPTLFNILQSRESIEVFSHLGITSLLFIVGVSLSPKVFRDVGKVSLIAGLGQVLFTVLFGYIIGILFGIPIIISLFLAIAFTFSSTIIVSKLLSDKHESNTLFGKIAIGMLLVQDVVATIVLIGVASTAGGGNVATLILSFLSKATLVAGCLYLASIIILPTLANIFAKSQEFLFLFAIGWGVGVSALFYALGLSIELGALAAGVSLASSPYSFEISAKMKLLRDFFIVLFFILLGSQLSIGNIMHFFWPIIAYALFILIGNPLIVMTIMGLLGYSKKTGFRTGLTVAQISEFSLILIMLGISSGHIPEEYLTLATAVGIMTIAASTFLILNDTKLYSICSPYLDIFQRKQTVPEKETTESYEAILFGCHRVGHDYLSSILKRKTSYLVVDFDPLIIQHLQERGIHARYGDAEDDDFLDDLHLEKTRIVISTIPEYEPNEFLIQKIRKVNKTAVIIAIADRIKHAQELYTIGATYVIMPRHMGGNYAAMLIDKHGDRASAYTTERNRHLEHLADRYRSDLQRFDMFTPKRGIKSET